MNTIYMLLLLGLFSAAVIVSLFRGYHQKKINNKNVLFGRMVTDTIRGISIFIIMFAHVLQQLGNNFAFEFTCGGILHKVIFSWGAVGVALFFFLSGYGNAASLERLNQFMKGLDLKSLLLWLFKRLVRLYVAFIICFVGVVGVLSIFGIQHMSRFELLVEFLHLRLPDCSTWYLKIQLLLYIFIVFSFWISIIALSRSKILNSKTVKILFCGILFVLTVAYYIIAVYVMDLPDYWWKTSLSFWMGVTIYLFKGKIEKLLIESRGSVRMLAYRAMMFVLFCLSYIFVLMAHHYSILHLLAYALLAFSMCAIMDVLHLYSRYFINVGAVSLELYLIHIGCMTVIDWNIPSDLAEYSVVIKVSMFIIISIGLAFLANKMVDLITSKLFIKRMKTV